MNEKNFELLTDGEYVKRLYHFMGRNPHFELGEAAQIVSACPEMGFCKTYESWNEIGRHIYRGKESVCYKDTFGRKKFVFDFFDTYGDNWEPDNLLPVKDVLAWLREDKGGDDVSDYQKIRRGVQAYLTEGDELSGDKKRDELFIEGVAYALYCMTESPESKGVVLQGLPYSVTDNVKLLDDAFMTASEICDYIADDLSEQEEWEEDGAAEEAAMSEDDAYLLSLIDGEEDEEDSAEDDTLLDDIDTEERGSATDFSETFREEEVQDDAEEESFDEEIEEEPVLPEEESEFAVSPLYQKYMAAQREKPDAFVLYRLGDFYEAMGDKAATVADKLDLTLTSREVGLPARIPMCGFPYVVSDVYIEKLRDYGGVVLIEDQKEPIYMLSHAEVREMQGKTDVESEQGGETAPTPVEDQIPTEERGGKETQWETFDDDGNPFDEQQESSESGTDDPEATAKPTAETKKEKGLKERRKKIKPQISIFDVLEPKEKSFEDQLLEDFLRGGNGIHEYKIDFYEKYQENPTKTEFAARLKKVYGTGGYSLSNPYSGWVNYDGKGVSFKLDGQSGQEGKTFRFKWNDVALRVADLIDEGTYLNEEEQKRHKLLTRRRAERKRASDEEELVHVLVDQIIDEATDRAYRDGKHTIYPVFFEESFNFAKSHKDEICEALLREKEVVNIEPPALFFSDEINLVLDQQFCTRSFRDEPTGLTADEKLVRKIARKIVREGTWNTESLNYITSFDRVGADKAFVKDHAEEIAAFLGQQEEVADVELDDDNFDVVYYSNYCRWGDPDDDEEQEPYKDDSEDMLGLLDAEEDKIISEGDNTDLKEIGFEQSELGGAKTRFYNNINAIELLSKLMKEKRAPSADEKKTLAKFVGWGGLSQAFDPKNKEWSKEYELLKGILSDEEYERARGSTLNAFYTSKEVIGGIYQALSRFGVEGNNRILEPAMGTGNFFGFIPREIADGAKLYGVELDNITGQIAARLYPQANVQIKGFEETTFSDNSFDIVVGNVPFGGYSVFDSAYSGERFLIHDYFLAKSLDKLKPNGLMAVVTSKGTMDKENSAVRQYLANRAELLGAIRLPNDAFKKTAGTEVVSDILFFRKREKKIHATEEDTEWLTTGKTKEGFEINNYFLNHPEMVLGTFVKETGLYGAEDVTVKSDGRPLAEALKQAINHLPEEFYQNPERAEDEAETIALDETVKPFCYKAEDGKLYMRVGDKMELQQIPNFPKDAYERIAAMIVLRSELHHVLDIQSFGCSDGELARAQYELNARYDRFVKRFGTINGTVNARLFRDDGDSALLLACENVDEKTGSVSKSDIFSKRTIRPYSSITRTDDVFEALQISKNEYGKVDIAFIERLTGKDYSDVLTELGNAVFRDPEEVVPNDKYSGFVTAEEYLSGYVVKKYQAAMFYAEGKPEFARNVEALKEVQPEPIKAGDIFVRLGSSWVDEQYYKEFYCTMLGMSPYVSRYNVDLFHNPHDGSWRLTQTSRAMRDTTFSQTHVYGTERATAARLFEDCMNLRDTTIYDTVEQGGEKKSVVNQAETIAAREKQNKIKEAFREWIFKDPERREHLEKVYNDLFNQVRLPNYDGSYLTFPGMNTAIKLMPHQRDVVQRGLVSGGCLMHHVVGSGKTYSMIVLGRKLKQQGLCHKPMYVVPNGIIQQWAGDWQKLYPNAKVLVATKDDLEKHKRRKFVSKVAMGDWDAILITQSAFAKIPISKARQIDKISEELTAIDMTIEAQKKRGILAAPTIKGLERTKKSRVATLQRLMDDSKKDSVLTFENLGVDYLFVDEADCYKNLTLYTKMNNVAGISNAASKRASDLKMKCEYIQELHGGDKGIVFATGTPISNSMTEMYVMQSYLQPRALHAAGIYCFDAWAADFGETVTALEMAPSGQGYRTRTRFKKFANFPELMTQYHAFADVKTADMLRLPVPKAERITVLVKPNETVLGFVDDIVKRAEEIYNGNVDSREDNMLKITSDGKKVALDARCFDPKAEDEKESKLNACVVRVYDIWQETSKQKGTQLIFCDLSTPKRKAEEYRYGKDFDVYNDIKYKLVQKGIPAEEIAFIHDAGTPAERQTIQNDMNSGKLRVLIGSTEKCGAGMNAQKRLVALHHLDAPYRPRDLEQREGRIIRQGNMNENVRIFTYVTEKTFDSYCYQILENKQSFIGQVNRGEITAREVEDIDERELSFAEIKAITAANPKIRQKMEVDAEIQRLRILEGQYKKNLFSLQDKIRKEYPTDIQRQELYLKRLREDIATAKEKYDPEVFLMQIGGKEYTDRKEAAKVLTDALQASADGEEVAQYAGFSISKKQSGTDHTICIAGSGQYSEELGLSASKNLERIENFMKTLPEREPKVIGKLEKLKSDLEAAKVEEAKPFEHRERLDALLSEQAQLNAELNLDKQEIGAVMEEEKEEGKDETWQDDDEVYGMALPTETELHDTEESALAQSTPQEEGGENLQAFKAAILPDYGITQEDMNAFGYVWDGMLPLTEHHAEMLDKMGCTIYALYPNNTDAPTKNFTGDISEHIYGIEKSEWEKFIQSQEGRKYLLARLAVREQYPRAMAVFGRDSSDAELFPQEQEDLEAFFKDGKPSMQRVMAGIEEHAKLLAEDYASVHDVTDAERDELRDNLLKLMKPFEESESNSLLTVIDKSKEGDEGYTILRSKTFDKWYVLDDAHPRDEFDKELDVGDEAMKYTIMSNYSLISDRLHEYDDQLSALAAYQNKVVVMKDNHKRELETFVDKGLSEIKWLEGRTTGFDEEDIPDLLSDLKPHFENSVFADKENFDEWYDDFSEEKLQPLLESRVAQSASDIEETGSPFSENTSTEFDFKEVVIESVKEELEAFKASLLAGSPDNIYERNEEIYVYNRFAEVIGMGDSYLDARDFRALYEDRGEILKRLYARGQDEVHSMDVYGDVAQTIRWFNEEMHPEIMQQSSLFDGKSQYYFGEEEGRGYYFLPVLDEENAKFIQTDCEGYVVAAYDCKLSDEQLAELNIQFLKMREELGEEEIAEGHDAIGNMREVLELVHEYRDKPLSTDEMDVSEKLLAIMYDEGAAAFYQGEPAERVSVDYLANSALCTKSDVEQFAESYGARIENDELIFNDALKRQMRIISERPNFQDFIDKIFHDSHEKAQSQEVVGQFSAKTKQGYPILSMFDDGERRYAIVRRDLADGDKDYLLARGYDDQRGEWAQGDYGFHSYASAVDYLRDEVPHAEEVENFKGIDLIFKQIVKDSVANEFAEYKAGMLKKTPEEIFDEHLKTNAYTELASLIENESTLTDVDYRALYEDKGSILSLLYDYYLKTPESSVTNGAAAAELVNFYNAKYHNDILQQPLLLNTELPYYFGRDRDGTAYHFLPALNRENLAAVKQSARHHVIVAPTCSLSQKQLEQYKIKFLKLGRDIAEKELETPVHDIENMQQAVWRLEPIYLETAEYAYQHGELAKYRASAWVNHQCRDEIDRAIGDNFRDSRLNKEFVGNLIGKYGVERVANIIAMTITESDWDKRYSEENRSWANTIPLTKENNHAEYHLNAHPVLVNAVADDIRKEYQKVKTNMKEEQRNEDDLAVNEPVNGEPFELLNNSNNQNQQKEEEEKMPEQQAKAQAAEQPPKNYVRFRVSESAVIEAYEPSTFMRMPKDDPEFKDYTYNLFNDRMRERLVRFADHDEIFYDVRLYEDETVKLKKRNGEEREITAKELAAIVDGKRAESYEREVYNFKLPYDAYLRNYDKSSLFIMPKTSEFAGKRFYLPNKFIDKEHDDISVHLPEDLPINLKSNDEEDFEISANELRNILDGMNAADFDYDDLELKSGNTVKSENGWTNIAIQKEAKIKDYGASAMFRMPNGSKYEGCVYYIPAAFVNEKENKDHILLMIPDGFTVNVKKDAEETVLSVEDFAAEVKDKIGSTDYDSNFRKPSEEMQKRFAQVEKNLRENVPEEMRQRPNWVVVRTRQNDTTGRLDKFLLNVKTGKFAESDNPETWTDFETACEYAREHGGVALAYALDGKDKIACIDVDGCIDEKGNLSEAALDLIEKSKGTYCEKSVSGKGLHFFGTTEGMDFRAFSKDRALEYYQAGHFITMTGDTLGSNKIKSFDTRDLSMHLAEKFDKRGEWSNSGTGVEGLSVMDDREVVRKASESRSGERFKALYAGQDLQNNHSNSDMVLMNQLAFWCNGDVEQMLRIFASSGLFRPDKPQTYYEHTAMKAVKGTTRRFQPNKTPAPVKKPVNSSDSGGKR